MQKLNRTLLAVLFLFCAAACPASGQPLPGKDHVVLLHGLGRTGRSMKTLERRFRQEGFHVINVNYPSRKKKIGALAEFLKSKMDSVPVLSTGKVHFVTHSMGGIVLRCYLGRFKRENLGRVVMISPPNRGSEIVDRLKSNLLFKTVYGPAAQQLGTDGASLPNQMGPVDFELGVITGDRSFNPLFSSWIPGDDDGKVSVSSAKVAGMRDFITVPYGHTFIMNRKEVVEQALSFIANGHFMSKGCGKNRPPKRPHSMDFTGKVSAQTINLSEGLAAADAFRSCRFYCCRVLKMFRSGK